MTKQELGKALEVASSGSADLNDLDIFSGFALPDFQPITCTIAQLAGLIVWQCFRFDGSTDPSALDQIRRFGRKRFNVV
jgi:hypothetical protein